MASVLIVDDEPISRSVLHGMLLSEGHAVQTVASACEALDITHADAPDVIITDIMMPGMDGLEFCRRLRSENRTRGTPIVAVTALGSREDTARALDAGATDFIVKPVNGVELRARIRSMVRIARGYQTLQQLLALRTDLTNMVIHDLRNPLQVIAFSAAALQRTFASPPVPLQRIGTQVVRLQQLIDDLLVIAKSEAGVLIANRGEIDARTLIALVIEDCRPAAETAKIGLLMNVAARSLYIDAVLLRRCLENLVLNAIKFSPCNTSVTIALTQNPGGVRIDVIDEGPGLPEALRESVFERFVTAEQKDRKSQQTGLGLVFCRMVAEAHEGTITMLPREGTGSVFRVWLPTVTPGAERARWLPGAF